VSSSVPVVVLRSLKQAEQKKRQLYAGDSNSRITLNCYQQYPIKCHSSVYEDQTKKAGQVTIVVINGLSMHQLSSDKNVVTNMLPTELNLHVDIVKCKRLGRPVPGKIQAVLAVLRSMAEADEVSHMKCQAPS